MAIDYIEALCAVYGRIEKLPDLMCMFEYTHQCRGERLSDYVVRVDRILHQIILKKAISLQESDKVRLERILRGARTNHPIVLWLLLKGTQVAPTYPELMKLVREEEAWLDENNQWSWEVTKASSKMEKVSAQPVQVENGGRDEESEWGECSRTPIAQPIPEATTC